MKHWIALVLLAISSTASWAASSSKAMVAKSIDIIDVSPTMITYLVDVECGEKPIGVIVSEHRNSTIGLAAVFERADVRCSLAPSVSTVTVPFISTNLSHGSNPKTGKVRRKIVSLLEEGEETRVALQEGSVSDTGSGLHIQWEKSCRDPLGFLMVPRSNTSIEVAVAFKAAVKSAGPWACESGRKVSSLTSIKTLGVSWLAMAKPGKIEDLYSLGLSQIRSIDRSSKGSLSVQFLRQCDELPIGVFMGGPSRRSAAVAVAKVPNVNCSGSTPTLQWLKVVGMSWNPKQAISAINASELNEIKSVDDRFVMLSSNGVAISKVTKQLSATIPVGCDRDLGVVVGNDAAGNIALSALNIRREGPCRVHFSQSKVLLPLQLESSLMPRVFPLRVAGSIAH